ncbi:transporter substrate-binding domain-containing protein [Rheinheimera soli]|uniref:transporter substrate-binding domain-containing protein n=1 Tax=Rheinheimera soli TaxID=443616 RepID=UPI001E46C4EC|nr:transporter substrate-binding domain-containing protein [Rheinheimera soli]
MMKNVLLLFVLLTGFTLQAQSSAVISELPASLKIGISSDTYPYMFVNEQGQAAGLVVDYWLEVARQQGIKAEFVAADWADTLSMLDSGVIDLHGGLGRTTDREQQYLLGLSYLDIFSNVFVHRDLGGVHNLTDLKPHLVGVVERSTHIDSLSQQQPDLVLKHYDSVSQMYDSALRGEIKAFTGLDRLPPRYARYRELMTFYPVYKKVPVRKIELTFAVRQDQVVLLKQLKEATATLDLAFRDQLERKWLSVDTDPNTLLIGVSIGNQPFMHVSPVGDVQGVFVDLWRLWSKNTGIDISFVPNQSEDSLAYLRKGRIDVQMAQVENKEKFTGLKPAYHLYNIYSSLFYSSESELTDPQQLKDATLGLLHTASFGPQVQQQFPDAKLKVFDTVDQMIEAVLSKQLTGFLASDVIVRSRLLQNSSQNSLKVFPGIRYESAVYSLTRAENEELYQTIQQGFSQISLDEMVAIENRWLDKEAGGYFQTFRDKVPLTDAERQWLNQHQQIRVGVMSDWRPVEFVDEKGEAQGITSDILKLLNQRLDVQFVPQPYSDWAMLLKDFKAGKLQMVANISDLPERRSFSNFSLDYWTLQWIMIGKHDASFDSKLAQMPGQRIAIMREYQFVQQLKTDFPKHQVIEVDSLNDGLEMVVAGQADFVLDTVVASGVAMRDPRYVNLRAYLPTDLPVYPSYFGVHKNLPELLVILNKGIKTINEADRKSLQDKWLNLEIKQGLDQSRVMTLVLQIAAVSMAVIVGFLIWNFSLRREVNLRRKVEEKMRFMAGHDDLTQLPNRSLLIERLQTALHQHARHNEMLALMFIDLDGFKLVNDQYGHDVGDEMLVKLSALLSHCVRKTDTVARFGGDEFVILLTGLVDKDDAAIVAEKILLYLQEPLALSVCQASVGASIGIAIYPHDGTDAATLLKSADKLMYQVKQQGKSQYRFSR